MNRTDAVISWLVLAPIAPIALLLAGWWGSFALLGDHPAIAWAAATGLFAGVVLDATTLRARMGSLFTLRMPWLVVIAVFYSVGLYGFFMGFVVVNVFVGIIGGYVIGRRAAILAETPAQSRRDAASFARVAAVILLVLCCASAWLALSQPSLPQELRGMFGLPFTPTVQAVRSLIIGGGIMLVAAQYPATLVAAKWGARRVRARRRAVRRRIC